MNLGVLNAVQVGVYNAADYDLDGFNTVNVAVDKAVLGDKLIVENGEYIAANDGFDGYSSVVAQIAGSPTIYFDEQVENGMWFFRDYFNYPITFHNPNNLENSFRNCRAFNSPVEIVNSSNASLYYAFADCWSFNQDFNVPENTSVITLAFYNCVSLNANINLTPNIIYMNNAFLNCRSLSHINIPYAKYAINAFVNCVNLRTVYCNFAGFVNASCKNYMFGGTERLDIHAEGITSANNISQILGTNNGSARIIYVPDEDTRTIVESAPLLSSGTVPTFVDHYNEYYNISVYLES